MLNLPVSRQSNQLFWYQFRTNTLKSSIRVSKFSFQYSRIIHTREDIEEWCMNTLKGKWSESIVHYNCYQVFLIKEKSDALLFKLTWSDELNQIRLPEIN